MHNDVATLLSTDPANITTSPANLTVNQSFSAQFSCTAFGNPIPWIVWSRDNDADLSNNAESTINITIVENNSQYMVTSFLLIKSTNGSHDAGMYNCTAINNVPNYIHAVNIQSAVLIVQGKFQESDTNL